MVSDNNLEAQIDDVTGNYALAVLSALNVVVDTLPKHVQLTDQVLLVFIALAKSSQLITTLV